MDAVAEPCSRRNQNRKRYLLQYMQGNWKTQKHGNGNGNGNGSATTLSGVAYIGQLENTETRERKRERKREREGTPKTEVNIFWSGCSQQGDRILE